MAKNPSTVNPSELVWIPSHNYGKHESMFDTESESAIHSVMLSTGWFTEQPVKVVELTEKGVEEALAYLTQRWSVLTAAENEFSFPTEQVTKLAAAEMREAFRATHMKGDKFITPKYEGVYAFQRGGAIVGANALRLKKGQKVLDSIPVIVMDYKNQAERVSDCIMENTAKLAGFKNVTSHWPTLCKGASELFESMDKLATQADITRVISGGDRAKVGNGQKAYAIIVLNSRFPHLGILNKILNGGKNEKGEDLGQAYGKSLDRDTLRELEIGTRQKSETPVEESEVEEYFANPNVKEPAKTPMKKKTIETLIKTLANCKTKHILQAILDDDVKAINKLESVSQEDNAEMKRIGLLKIEEKKPEAVTTDA